MIFSIPLIMRLYRYFILVLICFSCEKETNSPEVIESNLMFGGDFSISKKIQDNGYAFYVGNNSVDSPEVFYENGYTWARYRIFHTPNGEGAVCNDLEYTKESIKSAKQAGFKILLDFHYSDTWADPGKPDIRARSGSGRCDRAPAGDRWWWWRGKSGARVASR